jgi:hypothetical protein
MSGANYGARLASVESTLIALQEGQTRLSSAVDRLTVSFNERGRTPWMIVFAAFGLMTTIFTVIGRASLAPIEIKVAAIEAMNEQQTARMDRTAASIADNATAVREIVVALREVETQFRWLSSTTQMQDHQQAVYDQLLWRRVYNETLPSNGVRTIIGRE